MANARYQNRRSMMEAFYIKKLYSPVAKAHEFYKGLTPAQLSHNIRPSKDNRELALPKINWFNKLDLTDTNDFRQYISKMRDNLQVSMKTICRVFGIDYKAEEKSLIQEQGTVFDPLYQDYRKKHAEEVFKKTEGAPIKRATPDGSETTSPGGESMSAGGAPVTEEVSGGGEVASGEAPASEPTGEAGGPSES
jgi:hypothetical protein